jgi:putative ABC transport system substrate-binding protein
VTGVYALGNELTGKQLGLLHDLVPKAATIAVLVEPGARRQEIIELQGRARDTTAALGQKLLVLEASTAGEIDAQFARLDQEPADAMLVPTSPFFVTRAGQIVTLAARHRIPAIYARREYAEAGGLMSYGFNVAEVYREMGRQAGRILNGERPADLPIIQPTKFELVINLKAANAINLEIPPLVRALADEVIESFGGASSSRSSAARRHGRSRRARSRATACGASACSCRPTKTILWRRLTFLRSLNRLRASVGRMVATCGWTSVMLAVTPIG